MTTENTSSSNNIVEHIISLMVSVENSDKKTGPDKKQIVMKKIKEYLGFEKFERYGPLISMIIDSIVSISKNQILLDDLNKIVSKFCCC